MSKQNNKKDLIMWGTTGQSIVLEEFLKLRYNIRAFFDNHTQAVSPFVDIPLFYKKQGFEEWLDKNEECYFIVAIGGDKGKDRVELSKYLIEKHMKPISAINTKAILASNVTLGQGVQIMLGAVIAARVEIGDYTIINSTASIDHECKIGTGCHIAPGAKLAGNIQMGEYTFIGTGAVILPNIIIGKNCIIGAGSVVTKNIPNDCVVYGNPAKIMEKKWMK